VFVDVDDWLAGRLAANVADSWLPVAHGHSSNLQHATRT